MKYSLTVALMICSAFANAHEITRDQYVELMSKNKTTYEQVLEGMTAEYSTKSIQTEQQEGSEDINEETCLHHEKEVVVSTDRIDAYLVYIKRTTLNDCLDDKKGAVEEFLEWRELYSADFSIPSKHSEPIKNHYDLKGTLVSVDGTYRRFSDSSTFTYKGLVDTSKSQFYNQIDSRWEGFRMTLLRRSQTNPNTLNLDNLEVRDYAITEQE
jgi:hypothetical protein